MDKRKKRDHEIFVSLKSLLPNEKMILLKDLSLARNISSNTFSFLNDFYKYCNYPDIKFYNKDLEESKNLLHISISNLIDGLKIHYDEKRSSSGAVYHCFNNERSTAIIQEQSNKVFNCYVEFVVQERNLL